MGHRLGETGLLAAAARLERAGSSPSPWKMKAALPTAPPSTAPDDPFPYNPARRRSPGTGLPPDEAASSSSMRASIISPPGLDLVGAAAPSVAFRSLMSHARTVPNRHDVGSLGAMFMNGGGARGSAVPRAASARLHPEYVAARGATRGSRGRTRECASARRPRGARARDPAAVATRGVGRCTAGAARAPSLAELAAAQEARGGGTEHENSKFAIRDRPLDRMGPARPLAVGAPRGVGVARAAEDPGSALGVAAVQDFPPRPVSIAHPEKSRKKSPTREGGAAVSPRAPLFSLRRVSYDVSPATMRSRRSDRSRRRPRRRRSVLGVVPPRDAGADRRGRDRFVTVVTADPRGREVPRAVPPRVRARDPGHAVERAQATAPRRRPPAR